MFKFHIDNEIVFINEIISLQLVEEAKKSQKKEMCPFFIEYLGFILYSDINYEYFGSVLFKWHEMDNLRNYQTSKNVLFQKSQMVELVSQIARGNSKRIFV